jgi:hypothetical protein
MLNLATEVTGVHTWRARRVALGIVVSILLIGLWQVQQAVGRVRAEQSRASSAVGELVGSATVGQTFVSAYPGLSRVEVLLASYDRHIAGSFLFHLRAAPDASDDLVVLAYDASQVEENAFHVFQFPPIRDSAGRSFYFYLQAPQAESGNALTVWGSTQDAYPDGEAVFRGMQGRGVRDLTFRVGYDPALPERVGILLGRLTAAKPLLWGDRRWYVVLAMAHLALLYALFFRLARTGLSEKDGQV